MAPPLDYFPLSHHHNVVWRVGESSDSPSPGHMPALEQGWTQLHPMGLPCQGESWLPKALSLGKGELDTERTTILSPHKLSPDYSEINNTKSTENSMLAILLTIIVINIWGAH